jgi:hypothetical protein
MHGFQMDLLVALLGGVIYLDSEDFISKSEMLSRSQISFDCSGNCSTIIYLVNVQRRKKVMVHCHCWRMEMEGARGEG